MASAAEVPDSQPDWFMKNAMQLTEKSDFRVYSSVFVPSNRKTSLSIITKKTQFMKLKKKLFAVLALLAGVSMGVRADVVKYLVLNTTDGQQVIALADNPVMTISGNVLKVSVGGVEKVSASLTDVKNYSFQEQGTTAISEILADGYNLSEGHVFMSKVKAGETITVYSADSRRVSVQRVAADGRVDIDLTALPKGVYIVKSPNASIKVFNE